MPVRPLLKPRKNAAQDRSRATVDALIEATARILVREGFDKASTNRIAERAGVSVGSLYQYFPSKESLVAAVMERHNRELMEGVLHALGDVADLPVEAAMRRLVNVAIAAHRIDPKLHRVLSEQIPRTGRLAEVPGFNGEYYVLFRNYLEGHCEELSVSNLDLAAYVCVTAVEAVTHSAVIHRSEILTDTGAATLVDEVTRLVAGYLTAP